MEQVNIKEIQSLHSEHLMGNWVLKFTVDSTEYTEITLKASGSTSATTIQIIHPAANPVQKGRNLLNASAHMNEGTATMGCNKVI